MTRWLMLLLTLACADISAGPETARVTSLTAYTCKGDSLPCVYGAELLQPEPGKWFGVRAWAPGALALRETLRAPVYSAEQPWTFTRDTLAAVIGNTFRIPQTYAWLTWRVDVLYAEGRIVHADSLHWEWP